MAFKNVEVKIQIGVKDKERRVKNVPRPINGKIVVKAKGKTFAQMFTEIKEKVHPEKHTHQMYEKNKKRRPSPVIRWKLRGGKRRS